MIDNCIGATFKKLLFVTESPKNSNGKYTTLTTTKKTTANTDDEIVAESIATTTVPETSPETTEKPLDTLVSIG